MATQTSRGTVEVFGCVFPWHIVSLIATLRKGAWAQPGSQPDQQGQGGGSRCGWLHHSVGAGQEVASPALGQRIGVPIPHTASVRTVSGTSHPKDSGVARTWRPQAAPIQGDQQAAAGLPAASGGLPAAAGGGARGRRRRSGSAAGVARRGCGSIRGRTWRVAESATA